MSALKFTPPEATEATPTKPDTSMTKWRDLTEAMIFACLYWDVPKGGGYGEYLRVCARSGKTFSQASAERYCRALAEAINTEFAHIVAQPTQTHDGRTITPTRLLRAHAANDSRTFRTQYAHLLPKPPLSGKQLAAAERDRRAGTTPERRQRAAEALAAEL